MLELRACDERSVSATGVLATMLGFVTLSVYPAAYVGNNLSESHRTLGVIFSVTPCYESICSVHPSDVELSASHPRIPPIPALPAVVMESLMCDSVSYVVGNFIRFGQVTELVQKQSVFINPHSLGGSATG